MKKNIAVSITSRASYARCKSLLVELNQRNSIKLRVILTGPVNSNRFGTVLEDLSANVAITNDQISVFNTQLEVNGKSTTSKTTALGIISISDYLENNRTDALITIADRYETIASTIASKYMDILSIHLQGGEYSGNIDDYVRNANTQLSDIHFPATNRATERVRALTESKKIFNFGCPSIDLIKNALRIDKISIPGVGSKIDMGEPYSVVLFHPEYPSEISIKSQIETLLGAIEESKIKTFWFWPNADYGTEVISSMIRRSREMGKLKNVHFIKNMDPEAFLNLLSKSQIIIGNSSVGLREGSFLGIPAINLGGRQKNREHAENLIDVSFSKNQIKEKIDQYFTNVKFESSNLFGDGTAGKKIADQILKEI